MKQEKLLQMLTAGEKASLMSGRGFWDTCEIPRINLPSITLSDGPHGIRKQAGAGDHLGLNKSVQATCYPTAASMANTWNTELGEEIGRLLGVEARANQIDVLLGPGINIKRSPLCGRNFEYFSEDPYLAGKLGAAYVRGIQSMGVAACPKHFAANSQELRRMSNDSILDERTLREIYTTAFEIAVKEGHAKSIMSSYNRINGVYANENKHLLQEILVDEWGFDGLVVSDWGASNDHAKGVEAGSHLEMPSTGLDGTRQLLQALETGTLDSQVLDQRVGEYLDFVLKLKQEQEKSEILTYDQKQHHQAALRAAKECIVLLKNEEEILPLKNQDKIAVIGDFAQNPRYQGAGSSMVNPTKLDHLMDSIDQVKSAAKVPFIGYCQGFERNGEHNRELLEQAVEMAAKTDTVLLFLGLDEVSESEGLDREHLALAENQIRLLEAIAEVNTNIVVILSCGCAIEMPWINYAKGLVHGYLTGQAGAKAILSVLFGETCPSGKLAETFPLKLSDTPADAYYPGLERTSEYREGIFVGYRYYETAQVPVLFPFGFGLSYTEFTYENLVLEDNMAQVRVTNIGKMAGAEVVQMYVSLQESSIFRAAKELKGFQKVFLEPGESAVICISFDDKTFRYFNTVTDQWEVETGEYLIQIGSNIKDIRLSGTRQVLGTEAPVPYLPETLSSYYRGSINNISDREFEQLLDHPIPEAKWDKNSPLTENDCICQMYYAKSRLARLTLKAIVSLKNKSIQRGNPDLNLLFIYNIPFRGIAKMMGNSVSQEMVEGILMAVNGKFFKGIGKIVKGAIKNGKKEL